MSNIYIQEPPTRGKIVLTTTVGDIEIELFSKECPLACRNFVQLCMDGYYDGTIFHRVVPDFIAQGGDPTGTGQGGESATGSYFPDEFHTRLRFNRRGLVGMVNHGPNTNGSQFFFTLGTASELDKKNTLFGKVVGNTLFNMLKLSEGEIIGDTPVRPHKIIKTEVIFNPFDNMVANPRNKSQVEDQNDNDQKEKQAKANVTARAVKNYGLLSFGNEAEEDEQEISKVSMTLKQKGTGKSAHDLTDDATLSKRTIPLQPDDEAHEEDVKVDKTTSKAMDKSDAEFDKEELDRVRQRFNSKKNLLPEKKKKVKLDADDDEPEEKESQKPPESVKDEIERLKKELKQSKKSATNKSLTDAEKNQDSDNVPPPPLAPVTADTSVLIDELMSGTRRSTKKYHSSYSNSRENQTLDLLEKFRQKLHAVKNESEQETEVPVAAATAESTPEGEKEEFLKHRFISTDLLDNVHDIYTNSELLTVYDPRNPMTKRRREESSKQLQQKKQRGRTEAK